MFSTSYFLNPRNVERKYFFHGTTIRDTNMLSSSAVDLTPYKRFAVIASKSLDQKVKLLLQIDGYKPLIWDGTTWDGDAERSMIVDTNNIYILNTRFDWLNLPLSNLTISAQCDVAPTVGSLNVYVLGVRN